jgi:hypothetical protein
MVNIEQRVAARKIKLVQSPSRQQALPVTESVVAPAFRGKRPCQQLISRPFRDHVARIANQQ